MRFSVAILITSLVAISIPTPMMSAGTLKPIISNLPFLPLHPSFPAFFERAASALIAALNLIAKIQDGQTPVRSPSPQSRARKSLLSEMSLEAWPHRQNIIQSNHTTLPRAIRRALRIALRRKVNVEQPVMGRSEPDSGTGVNGEERGG